jgi:hypothetical protein
MSRAQLITFTIFFGILVVTSFWCAVKPQVVINWMLRDADGRLGRVLRVRQKVASPDYVRQVRAGFTITSLGALAMFWILVVGIFRMKG